MKEKRMGTSEKPGEKTRALGHGHSPVRCLASASIHIRVAHNTQLGDTTALHSNQRDGRRSATTSARSPTIHSIKTSKPLRVLSA